MSHNRELDIIVYGATGYTGKLVAEYLNTQYGVGGDVSWAIAGRSQEKLNAVREELGLPEALPLIVADASPTVPSTPSWPTPYTTVASKETTEAPMRNFDPVVNISR